MQKCFTVCISLCRKAKFYANVIIFSLIFEFPGQQSIGFDDPPSPLPNHHISGRADRRCSNTARLCVGSMNKQTLWPTLFTLHICLSSGYAANLEPLDDANSSSNFATHRMIHQVDFFFFSQNSQSRTRLRGIRANSTSLTLTHFFFGC